MQTNRTVGSAFQGGWPRLHPPAQPTPWVPHSCASFAQEWETTLIAQWALPFTAAVSVLRYRHPFQPCHPERNFVIGKANDKVESKDPMFVDTTPGNARHSHRAIIGWVDQPLRVLCAR